MREDVSMDYLSYWSLLRRPFTCQEDPCFFTGVPQREAIAGLNYFFNSQLRAATFVAPRRCGSTTLLQHIREMRGFGDRATELILTPGIEGSTASVFQRLSRSMGFVTLAVDPSKQVDAAIRTAATHGVGVVWLIDQGSTATGRVARELVDSHPRFSVLIATTPGSYARRVIEFGRTPMRMDLSALSRDDSIEYVRYSVEHAGGRSQLFGDDAIVRMHEVTCGALANLSQLAESCLALAAIHQLDEVTPGIVEAIQEQQAAS